MRKTLGMLITAGLLAFAPYSAAMAEDAAAVDDEIVVEEVAVEEVVVDEGVAVETVTEEAVEVDVAPVEEYFGDDSGEVMEDVAAEDKADAHHDH